MKIPGKGADNNDTMANYNLYASPNETVITKYFNMLKEDYLGFVSETLLKRQIFVMAGVNNKYRSLNSFE